MNTRTGKTNGNSGTRRWKKGTPHPIGLSGRSLANRRRR